jgi:UDP-N-acetylmuramoyl-L-alanyl-D-glutamate--2,6-diaminopimelate ligase
VLVLDSGLHRVTDRMILNELLTEIEARSVTGDLTAEVSGVQYDSRAVRTGSVFVAIRGEQADGNAFVRDAVTRGAVAIVSEEEPAPAPAWIQVASDRSALSALAAALFRDPTRQLQLIGITGTNGKTTTAHVVESILGASGNPAAMLGTIDYRFPGFSAKAIRTTPEAPELESLFRQAVDTGCRHAVMEVSSHAIAMHRVEALDFDVVAFTNLSGEHLDFHGSIEEYFAAKKRLFSGLDGTPPHTAVLNRDDSFFDELARCGNERLLSFGMTPDADIYPVDCDFGGDGIEAQLATPSGKISLKSSLLGRGNLYNIAAAVGIGLALDLPPGAISEGIAGIDAVPGRFEKIDCGQRFRVIVDYAHTDDALAKVLDTVREITSGRVIVVFGAGGDRDKDKRERMGEAVALGSDLAVVTSDNPRNEDPDTIIGMIEEGLRRAEGRYEAVPDRRGAIARAFEIARPGDTVVIAGKGHETVQVVGNESLPFDDRDIVRELLTKL